MSDTIAPSHLHAGAARVDVTPRHPIHLAGYPHVLRMSTGIHDPLFASALVLQSGDVRVAFVAVDVIYTPRALVERARRRIEKCCGIPAANVLISATHTHSGPKMMDPLATSGDAVIPATDPAYVSIVEDGIVTAVERAAGDLRLAEAGLAEADATGVGTNRRDPNGPSDLRVPVLVVRDASTQKSLAALLVCCMHPTVLHEDSTLISGDFPAMARQYLAKHSLGDDCVFVYHTGPAGNQSPRHVTRGNTFAEAIRLGEILGAAVKRVLPMIHYAFDLPITVATSHLKLPLRSIVSEAEAKARLDAAAARLETLRSTGAPRTEVRTAETDWFGAEQTLTLARAKASGLLEETGGKTLPSEVQIIRIGPWTFVAWPGEIFIEFALELKRQSPETYVIAYANGELQGYLVTKQAVEQGGYEASHALFKSPESGEALVATTRWLLKQH